ncbi:MAG: hypothetical protein V3T17_03105 [Pseudomonadales bacterium]
MNNASGFQSDLATPLSQFISLKQLSGFEYKSSTTLLHQFDVFLSKQKKCHYQDISKHTYEQYLESIKHLAPRSIMNHVTVIKQFD